MNVPRGTLRRGRACLAEDVRFLYAAHKQDLGPHPGTRTADALMAVIKWAYSSAYCFIPVATAFCADGESDEGAAATLCISGRKATIAAAAGKGVFQRRLAGESGSVL